MVKKLQKPLLVTQPSIPSYEQYTSAIKSIWDTKWVTNQGPLHNLLRDKLQTFLNVKNVTLFVNGHSALDCAMKALKDEKNGGEIITTPFTFVSTTHAIALNGFTPVFCDIKETDYTIDENKIEDLITDKTVAIVATHVYGYPCNVKEISRIAKKHKLKVVYDAAHAFAVEVGGEPIGRFGDISMISFHATKVFNTIEGGALMYEDLKLRKKLDMIKDFGIDGPEKIASFGINAKMNEFQAAMGLENLKSVKKNIKNRKMAAEIYYKRLSKIPGIKLVKLRKDIKYNYAYMPILIDKKLFSMSRDGLYDELAKYNVFARKYFYPLISSIDVYKGLRANVPTANDISNRILCLPISGDIKKAEVEAVCEIIEGVWRSQSNG